MAEKKESNFIEILVMKGQVLGVDVYRGFAKLSDISRISRPDIFDQKTNPTGTQRDLNPKHAREAYEYVKNHDLAYWTEVFLNVREPKAISFIRNENMQGVGILRINLNSASNPKTIAISRVDGNHRLHYADGHNENYPAIDKIVSFSLAFNLSLEDEITLFRDINNNQRAMNTSHLDSIKSRLTPEEEQKRQNPEIYIAKKLSEDTDSPFYGRIHHGGVRHIGQDIPLRAMDSGIKLLLNRSARLGVLEDTDAKYKVIKNYFQALKKWLPESWSEPRKYLTLRGAGLWAVCLIGAEVIDRTLLKGEFSSDEMYKILSSGVKLDWSNKGDFKGYSGVTGAQEISNRVIREFQEEGKISVKNLYSRIMNDSK
jgi:DGQHR domain-containing protein